MSGTCLIDVLEGGDFSRFLSVNGSYDLALDSQGIIDDGSFSAYPWSDPPNPPLTNDLRWMTGNPIERWAPGGSLVEEWLRVYEQCHARNDLATDHDTQDAWVLPTNGASAGTLTVGGTQFNGHVFCKRSWWHHVTRNRYCIERAIAAGNMWAPEFAGSHTGSGTISGSAFSGSGSGTTTGTPAGSYSITISGVLTGIGPDGTFGGAISGSVSGIFAGTIVGGVVTVTYTFTSPAYFTVVSTGNSFTVGGGGTTFAFSGSFSGSPTPDSQAEAYINNSRQWSTGGDPAPIRNGKFVWNLGWRRLLFPWDPVTTAYGTGNVYQVGVSWNYGLDADWDHTGGSFLSSGSSAGGSAIFGVSASAPDVSSLKTATWIVIAGDFFTCSDGDTITRPKSTLRNLFGWEDGDVARIKRGPFDTPFGAFENTFTVQLGFFWHDGPFSPNLDWPYRYIKDESTILGTVGTSEANYALDSILDIEWPAVASQSSTRRYPCFWIGPQWGSAIGTPGPGEEYRTRVFTSGATDNAATAGVNHNVRFITDTGGGHSSPRIGTAKHPFFSPLGGAS